ncbi:MAG: hypothetical protein QM756_47340 [Polyangiaceae bacterium]
MALVKLLLDVSTEVAELVGQTLIELGAGGVEEQSGTRGARLIVYGDDQKRLSALAEQARGALSEYGLDEDSGNLSIRLEVDRTRTGTPPGRAICNSSSSPRAGSCSPCGTRRRLRTGSVAS